MNEKRKVEELGGILINDLHSNIEGYDVLVLDDIVDLGNTMKFIINHLQDKNPKLVKSCFLLDKPERRQVEIEPDYCGFKISDRNIENIFLG